jgi:hypothetical protein
MKKILLLVAVITTMTTTATANTSSELATLKAQMAQMMKKIEKLESQQLSKGVVEVASIEPKKKETLVRSKASVLKFSGKHYLGFVSDNAGADRTNAFETRRNYLQIKGYFAENPKDYFRITLDTFHNTKDDGKDKGSWEVRLKYAYLYLDNVLPYTGVEIGQSHRPWIDYEEHHGWNYRSISKVFVEAHDGAHFTNSADLGVNFKTKTDYFSSELGLFNGEGYHGIEDGNGLSGEWRLTGHLLGTGKKHVHKHDTYADVSFFGQYNTDYKVKDNDFVWYGLHAVYNQPEFLLSAQYVKASDGGEKVEGDGYSVNGEFRFTENWNLIGRYDNFTLDKNDEEKERMLGGISYQYNKNVEFIANYLKEEVENKTVTDAIMLSAEVNW